MTEDGEQKTKTPLPRVQFSKLAALSRDLRGMLDVYRGVSLTPELASKLAFDIAAAVDDNKTPLLNIQQTVALYTSKVVTQAVSLQIAAQITGRWVELRHGPLVPFEAPSRNEWIVCELVKVENCFWKGKPGGRRLHLFCHTGHPSGTVIVRDVPFRWTRYLAYQTGYSRRYKFSDNVLDLIGFVFFVYVEVNEGFGGPTFKSTAIDVSPEMKKRNQVIAKLRTRLDRQDDVEEPPKELRTRQLDQNGESARRQKLAAWKIGHGQCPFNHYHECRNCSQQESACPAAVKRDYGHILVDRHRPLGDRPGDIQGSADADRAPVRSDSAEPVTAIVPDPSQV